MPLSTHPWLCASQTKAVGWLSAKAVWGGWGAKAFLETFHFHVGKRLVLQPESTGMMGWKGLH